MTKKELKRDYYPPTIRVEYLYVGSVLSRFSNRKIDIDDFEDNGDWEEDEPDNIILP